MHLPRRTLLFAPLVLSLAACQQETATTRPATLVRTELVRPQARQNVIRLTGDVQARVSTELSFRVSGRVTERLVDVGAHVNAGDVLARIDPTEQKADLEGSKAAVAAAEAQLRVATATFERQKTLMASGFTTRVSYDQAQEGLRTAEGSLETAKAQLGTSADALTYTDLRANAAGIITARNIEVGQVAQSAQSAYTLAEDGARDAVFDVYESIFPAAAGGRYHQAGTGFRSVDHGRRAGAGNLPHSRSQERDCAGQDCDPERSISDDAWQRRHRRRSHQAGR